MEPTTLSATELKEQLERVEREADQTFIEDYKDLVRRHGRQLRPDFCIVQIGGETKRAEVAMNVQRLSLEEVEALT